jgi:hypothetical protein
MHRKVMPVTLRAHFDGKVIVPDEPVNLPVNAPLKIEIRRTPRKAKGAPKIRNGVPLARNDGRTMSTEEVASILNEG